MTAKQEPFYTEKPKDFYVLISRRILDTLFSADIRLGVLAFESLVLSKTSAFYIAEV